MSHIRPPTAGVWVLGSQTHRQLIGSLIATSPPGWVVQLSEPNRTLQQNAALHSHLTDIANQVEWHGKRLSVDVWKRLCTASWLREIGESPEMVPALDGKGFDVIFEKTSKMSVKQLSSLLDWVSAFGAENFVTFKDDPAPAETDRRSSR